ncbi:hypothetical protein AAFC00_001331 [Neodothiora populina]
MPGPPTGPGPARGHSAGPSKRSELPFLGTPLGLRTTNPSLSVAESVFRDRLGTDSPSHQMQYLPTPPFSTLSTSSSRTDRLPSFRQLSRIADGGTESMETRATTSYPALPTHPSTVGAQSPAKSLPYFTGSQQSSPALGFAVGSHSLEPSTRPDSHEGFAVPLSPAVAYGSSDRSSFAHRRRSFGSGHIAPSFVPTLTTSSSNDTNVSYQSSGADSYTTTSTTPIEHSASEETPLPSNAQHSPSAGGVFTCEYPGCSAPPFQTQYLLNSHANVHSSNRPHFCPVKGCPRSEGGKGFKRKNEMIRHGLVHDSPGYICPFCPLREHKYPRPDNLQRHVRVHHVDKDKDDPLLREVLSQRPEGGNRGRRRRTGP